MSEVNVNAEEFRVVTVDAAEALDRVTAERDAALEEVEALKHWRDIALQFDNHRMKALWHLKTLVSDGAHYDAAAAFLTEAPIPASELQQRLTAAEALSVTRILLDVVPGDGSGQEVYAKSVAEVEGRLSDLAMQAEDLQSSNAQLRDRKNSIVMLQKRTEMLERLLREAQSYVNDVAHDPDVWLKIESALNATPGAAGPCNHNYHLGECIKCRAISPTEKAMTDQAMDGEKQLNYYEQFQCPECEVGTLKEKGYAWHCDSCEFIAPEQDGDLDE